MLTTDTWQLGWRPTDINIANYVFYYPNPVGNETGTSDPIFMEKHAAELKKDTGKWIDSSVWHGKAHTWEKIKWLNKEVRLTLCLSTSASVLRYELTVEAHLWRSPLPHQGYPVCRRR